MFNVQLLLLSKIGQPYDPVANTGVIGRNFTHQTCRAWTASSTSRNSTSIRSSPPARSACASTSSTATISITARSASSAAAISARCRPTAARSRPRRCRRARRNGAPSGRRRCADNYLSTLKGGSVHGSFYSYRDVYLDLDPDLQRPLRPAADAHDHRLPRQRAEGGRLTDRQIRRDRQGDGRRADRQAAAQRPLRHHQISDDASQRRRDHGHRSARPARSTAICRAGTCRTCS